MNWLVVNHSNDMHGAERVCLETVAALCNAGHRVTVVVPCQGEKRLFEAALPSDVCVLRLPYKAAGVSGARCKMVDLYNLPALWRLKRYCRRQHIERIYASTYIVDIASALARSLRLPLYWHLHEEPTPEFDWSPSMAERYRKVFSSAHLIWLSERQRTLWQEALSIPLNGPVLLNPIRRIDIAPIPHDGLHIGYLGKLEERKNLPMLLRVFARFKEQNPTSRLTLCGASCAAELRAYAAPGVEVRMHTDDVASFYAEIDILVLPSRRETMPLVVGEAMQAGVAVLQTTESGMRERLTDGYDTLFISPDDEDAWYEALCQLSDADYRAGMQAAACETISGLLAEHDYHKEILTAICE